MGKLLGHHSWHETEEFRAARGIALTYDTADLENDVAAINTLLDGESAQR